MYSRLVAQIVLEAEHVFTNVLWILSHRFTKGLQYIVLHYSYSTDNVLALAHFASTYNALYCTVIVYIH